MINALSAVVKGVAAFDVLTISNEPSAFLTNHVQLEPKLPTHDLVKASLKASNEPHFALMASAKAPVGAPLPFGFRLFQ